MFDLEKKWIVFVFVFFSGETHTARTVRKRKAFHFLVKQPPSLPKIHVLLTQNSLLSLRLNETF